MFNLIKSIKKRDPAANNYLEIILFYPGLHALILHKIANKFWKIQKDNDHLILTFDYVMHDMNEEKKKNLYKKALLSIEDLTITLNEIKDLNIKLNIDYYSKKKIESQKKTSLIKENIKIYSQNESRSIFIAFFIQLIIFFIIQFFEFGFEIVQGVKRQKKTF